LRIVTEDFFLVFVTFTLVPMSRTFGTDEDEVKTVLSGLGVSDGFLSATVRANDILATGESGVLNALRIDIEVFCTSCVVCPVHTVVDFITLSGSLVVVTHVALELEVGVISLSTVFHRLEHVITLLAEAHSLELGIGTLHALDVLFSANHFNYKL
jgi:hypothetical protein